MISEAIRNAKKKIDSGTDFEDLVIEISEDEGTKELKGSLGVTDGTLLPPEFEEALLTMEESETFGPIELSSSVHLIKLDDLIQPQPLEKEDKYNTNNFIYARVFTSIYNFWCCFNFLRSSASSKLL